MFVQHCCHFFVAFLVVLLHAPLSRAALRRYNFTIHSETRAPDGFSREVYLINGQQPGPLIDVDEGDELEVFVQNDLPVDTTIHWHGILQRGTPHMDGVPGVSQYPILPGTNFTYRFTLADEYGFFWYHSHLRAYYNDAIRGGLLIRPSPSRGRPFEKLATSDLERSLLLQAERDATSILLNDWTHELSDVVWSRYFTTGAFPNCVDSVLANGYGRVECLPEYMLQAGPGLGQNRANQMSAMSPTSMIMSGMAKRREMGDSGSTMDMGSSTMVMISPTQTTESPISITTTMSPEMTSLGPRGCTMPMMFKSGFNASSLPPETCTNTSSTQLLISANTTQGWLALNLVNSGAVSALRVSLDGHSMFVYAADGLFVELQEVKVLHMALGQRYSVMIRLNQTAASYFLRFATFPVGDMQQVLEGQAIVTYNAGHSTAVVDDPAMVWTFTNGSAKLAAPLLDPQRLSPFESTPPSSGAANQTHVFTINQTDVTTWVVNNNPFQEPQVPIVYGTQSDAWQANTTYHMPSNSVIDIVLKVADDSMDMMGHPMHLHGHKFWVLGTGSGPFPYATVKDVPSSLLNLHNPPYRDTTELPPSGWAVIRYVTDNPGAWIFHCHLQWHIVSGMAVVLVEGDDQLPGLVGNTTSNTSTADRAHAGEYWTVVITIAVIFAVI
ncbi:Multicopper oxidase [Coniochaeta hoffmannii]|uniref:Multicopper oxidase n=1 Tax=Coniochaeta hoffmannii TaxID=91930 RepID=A0AA38RJD1_9PEZI|nr:Multicopper oxidase [Coniochaeta hoffmannii]